MRLHKYFKPIVNTRIVQCLRGGSPTPVLLQLFMFMLLSGSGVPPHSCSSSQPTAEYFAQFSQIYSMQIQFCNSNCESNLTLTNFTVQFYIKRRIVFFSIKYVEAKCAIIHSLLNLFQAYEGLPKLINVQQSKIQHTSTI